MHFSHLMPLGTPMVIFCVSLQRTKKNESLLVVGYYVTNSEFQNLSSYLMWRKPCLTCQFLC